MLPFNRMNYEKMRQYLFMGDANTFISGFNYGLSLILLTLSNGKTHT
jgi:hypothetical protein